MRRVIAIVFMLLLTTQSVLVALNYSQNSYAVTLDEEQKEKVGKEEQNEIKEMISSHLPFNLTSLELETVLSPQHNRLKKPYLDSPTPPPDHSC